MQINNALNLVFPIRSAEQERPDPKDPQATITVSVPLAYAYHLPIDAAVFEANYRIIAETKAELFGKGVAYMSSATQIARLTLLDVARAYDAEWGREGSGKALLAEIKHRTTILAAGANGFEYVDADLAIQKGIIDAEDWAEAESALVFFTCGYAMAKRKHRESFATASARGLAGSITSLSPTEFVASLPTSTPESSSTVPAASSVPS